MQNTGDNGMPIQEAMKLAQSPAGQQLIKLLQETGGQDLRSAMEKAAAGDYSQAKQAISALMNNPEAKKLLKQMGGMP